MDDEVSKGRPVSTPTLNGFRTLDIQTDRLPSSWLREAGVPDGALKANESAPDFLLPEANGKLVSSLELRQTAPLIVTFVYGTWSPLCAAGLRALHGAIPSIRAAGAGAIAITPETGDLPRNFKRDHRLDLQILSDLDLGVGLSFGPVSVVPAEIKSRLVQRGLDLSAPNGFSFWMLPMPATYVLDQRGIIRRACVGQDSITGATTESVRNRSRLGFRQQHGHLVMTIQRAKNREFPNVIMLWPHTVTGSEEHLRRLLYNGITRAQNHCTVIVLVQGRQNAPPFTGSTS